MNFFSFAFKIPGYVFGLHALCMWLYLIADNVDGKQARATKSATPIGKKISFFPN
jgi:phosphatidylglycerophosphate synthase